MPGNTTLELDLGDFLPYRLSVLSNTVSTAIAGAYARRFGLTIAQWRVVAVLARSLGSSWQPAPSTASI